MSEELIDVQHPQFVEALGRKPIIRMSANPGKVFAALAKAQLKMTGANKSSVNPAYGSSYADLAEVIEVASELAVNEVAILQGPSTEIYGGIIWAVVETMFGHSSGEWVSSTLPLPIIARKQGAPVDAQTCGAAITYDRRYSLSAMARIAQQDDDGESVKPEENGASVGATAQVKQPLQAKTGWKPSSQPPPEDSESFKGQIPPEDNADLFGPPDSAPQPKGVDFVIDYPPELAGKKASDLSKQELKRIAAMKRKAIANGKYVEQNTSQLRFIESLLSVPF